MHTSTGIKRVLAIGVFTLLNIPAYPDNVLYRYEGDVLPYDASAGFEVHNACKDTCSETIVDGHFVQSWTGFGDDTNYHYWIALEGEPQPETFWVEFRFRSNETYPGDDWACDGRIFLGWKQITDLVYAFGDSALSSSGGTGVFGLDIDEFHTYRFESTDGVNYTFFVDGQIISVDDDSAPGNVSFIQFGGSGTCDLTGTRVNEWDYIRFGEIVPGATIVSTDPPQGNIDPAQMPGFDRFVVTFDQPHYVYNDDISIVTTGGNRPEVLRTWRLEGHEPETLEIVLDRPLPIDQTTVITLDDGTTTNQIVYTYGDPVPVPTTSEWGLAVMGLLVVTAGGILVRRSKAVGVVSIGLGLLAMPVQIVNADEVLHRYEGDVHPLDPSTGWIVGNTCDDGCFTELDTDSGFFVMFWPGPGDFASFAYRITVPPESSPQSLWVEWRFRSNNAWGQVFNFCDADFDLQYQNIFDNLSMYGDSAQSLATNDVILGLDLNAFHTYRFESSDGTNYTFAVDGSVFVEEQSNSSSNGYDSIKFGGTNSCGSDFVLNKRNEWDVIQFGTLSDSALIVATDPPQNIVDPLTTAVLDRLTVTFDRPAYLYTHEVTVQTSGGSQPQVVATRRLHNGEPTELEIVLDSPMPFDEVTTFTFDDGAVEQTIQLDLTLFGPCCFADDSCSLITPAECLAQGGTLQDVDLPCEGDQDGDGVDGTCGDTCPLDPDDDIDGDGLCGDVDPCPFDFTNDSDADGLCDGVDPCQFDPFNDIDNDGVCGDVDPCPRDNPDDSDGDGVCDSVDQCPGVDDSVFAPQCTAQIPATSAWSLTILALLLLVFAKLKTSIVRQP